MRTINLTALLKYLDMTALLELWIFILSTIIIVDGQILAKLLKVILVNFNESISKITRIVMIIIITMMICFILSWQDVGIVSIVSSNNLQQ